MKYIVVLFIFILSLCANVKNTDVINELNAIKLEIAEIKITQQYLDDSKKIDALEQSIKNLSQQYQQNNIDKNNINNDMKIYDTKLNSQSKRLEDNINYLNYWGIGFGMFGLLITIIVLILTFSSKREAILEAKQEANKAVEEWIKKNANEELKPYLENITKSGQDILKKIEEKADGLLRENKDRFDNLISDIGAMTNKDKKDIEEKAKNINRDKTNTPSELNVLFLSSYMKGNFEKSLEFIDELISKYKDNKNEKIQETVAQALNNKGVTLGSLDRSEDELKIYDELISKYKDDKNEKIQETVAQALYNKGVRLGSLDRSEDALKIYDELISKYKDDKNEKIQEQVESGYINKLESLLITNKEITDDIFSRYEKLKKANTMNFDMIHILYHAKSLNQDKEIVKFEEDYLGIKLQNWGFGELDMWHEKMKDENIKERIGKYILIFKKHL